ncbi:MAG: biotin--[acetyl-CoA-carboxylase] ligase [Deltaproteobacteria bacterium]|nr:biotin--[acetyl-CoA-carboxylase] ligase [Deltaproteobacteria bacterium]
MIEAFTTPWGSEVEIFTELDSTNRYLKSRARAGAPHGLVVVAETQTAGSGRRGRQWHSPAGLNLYFSLLLRPELGFTEVAPFSLAVAVALKRALDPLGGELMIKWPNDLYGRGGKLAGILAEMEPGPDGPAFVIIGIGLNVNAKRDDFPPELRARATSLALEYGRCFERGELLGEVLEKLAEVEKIYSRQGLRGELGENINSAFYLSGREIVVVAGKERVRGIARGIDDRGRLRMLSRDGRELLFAAGEAWLEKKS